MFVDNVSVITNVSPYGLLLQELTPQPSNVTVSLTPPSPQEPTLQAFSPQEEVDAI
jgi:hypothetical protein